MTESERNELITAACHAREQAYAPYSKFQVGAALRTPSGRIYLGANVENASFGLTLCAERVAVGTAITAGDRQWVALAVASSGGCPPCGACRQVLCEWCDDMPVLLVDADRPDQVVEVRLRDLLPGKFSLP